MGSSEGKANEVDLISLEYEAYFAAVFEVSGVALGIVESDGIVSLINDRFEFLSGYSREEVIGKMSWSDFVAPEHLEKMKRYHINRRKGIEAPSEYECELFNKSGDKRRVRVNVSLIPETSQSIISLLDLTDLYASQENYRQLFESSITGIFIHDMDGNIVDVNKKVTEMLGFSREELLSKKWGASVAPEEKHRAEVVFDQIQETGFFVETSKFKTSSGDNIDVEIHGSIVEVDGTKYIQSHVLDVSDTIKLRDRYRGFMQSATDSFSIYDENLNVVDANSTWEKATGLNREEAIGRHILDVFPYLDKTPRYAAYQRVIQTGKPIEFKATENTTLSDRYFDVKAFKIEGGFGLISTEVTEKIHYRQRVEALHRLVSRLSDVDTREKIAEQTMEIIRDLLGLNIGSIGFVEENKIVFTAFREDSIISELCLDGKGLTVRAVNTGKTQLVPDTWADPNYISGRVKASDETRSELDVPVKVDENVVAVINLESNLVGAFSENDKRIMELLAEHVGARLTALRYRSEHLRAERAEMVSEFKSRFLRTATHELRTPLTSMKGFLELARETDDLDLIKRYMDIAFRNTQRLETLTEDLLDQQRLEDGRLQLELGNVNLVDLITRVIEEISPIVNERCQTIVVDMPERISIFADNLRLTQVFVNLLSNSSKYSPKGSKIHVSVGVQDDHVLIGIKDEGYGFTDEELEKIFMPFPDISRPVVTEQSVGLGLSICKGLIELHGGEIWIKSDGREKGSTVSFTIPYQL